MEVMETSSTSNQDDQSSSTAEQAISPAETIAISATDLIEMIHAGHGIDLNALVNQKLHDRAAA